MNPTNERGITLIALIITVIILLILAGTAISIAINGGDIFSKASTARELWNTDVEKGEEEITNVLNILQQASNPLEIPEGLVVGDIVNWTPSGHYTWDKDIYASSDSATIDTYTSGQMDVTTDYIVETKELFSGNEAEKATEVKETWNSGTNLDFTVSEWKVLSVDKQNKTIKLVPTKVSIPVPLQGAQGYNNGVKLLNDACKALYGGNTYGVEVHNINIDDIEGLMTTSAAAGLIATAKASTMPAYPAYEERYENNEGQTSNRNTSGAYTTNAAYPTIYAEERLRKITNSDDTINESMTGLGLSDARSRFISRANEIITKVEANEIVTKTAKTIHPANTFYYFSNTNIKNALGTTEEKTGSADLILPNEVNTNYWVASRCVRLGNDACGFFLRCVYSDSITAYGLLVSNGINNIGGAALGLFPIAFSASAPEYSSFVPFSPTI